MNIPTEFLQRSILKTQLSASTALYRTFAGITTMIKAVAKTVDIPKLSVTAGKNHELACKNSIGIATASKEPISITNKSDNSVDYCEDDFHGDMVGFKKQTKAQLVETIVSKVNGNAADALLAGATADTGTLDTSVSKDVNAFFTKVVGIARRNKFS